MYVCICIYMIVQCPHCSEFIIIKKLNCKIFRHGVFISNNKQINPHASKELCEQYIKKKLIYGCGKPFMIDDNNNAVVCDYI